MLTDKEVKKNFLATAIKAPEKYYPIQTLKDAGFKRGQCKKCKKFYWSVKERTTCGDSTCIGGFTFIGKRGKQLSYIESWNTYKKIHEKLGYTAIERYPVVARWRDDTDFVQAGIYDFQPYVVTGEVDPPANPIIEPQFCLRFNDIDNVGITGAHYVGFDMLGEHAFYPPHKFNKNKYLHDHLTWLKQGMGIPFDNLVLHEDVWAGGGNFGPSIEFFSGGLELSNQVYMQFEVTATGTKPLALNVLDMGQGHERIPWFTSGNPNSYETTFPTVIKTLRNKTGLAYDSSFMKKFVPYAPLLNVDEVEDINQAWKVVAREVKTTVQELKKNILPNAALYSIAEHSRALLVALHDGALPSNVGGMYNLRVILRRSLALLDTYNWKVNLPDLCREHAEFLKPLYPELTEKLDNVQKILDIEKKKYEQTKQKTKIILKKVFEKELSTNALIELYDNKGISPDMLKEQAKIQGRQVHIPDNFYALVTAKHEKTEKQATKTEREEKLSIQDIAKTEIVYFKDWKVHEFRGIVLKIINNHIILDKTAFYPVSGGQLHDKGTINDHKVIDVFKQGNIIVHTLEKPPSFKEGDSITGIIDLPRRKQLTQHHTATHIINAAARKVLGDHINQASAKKDIDKGYLDVTHYENISEEELEAIEKEANTIIWKKIPITKIILPRTEAEQRYGMRIYQGGAVPGRMIRIVDIKDTDVEACGGTHLNNTLEAEHIKIIKTTKVKDGVVRITFTAGEAARQVILKEEKLLKKISEILEVDKKFIVHRAEELYKKWKVARKAVNKNKEVDVKEFELISQKESSGSIIAKTAEVLGTQPAHILKTLERFIKELQEFKQTISARHQ